MEMVPLRELMEAHHKDVVKRLDRIDARLDSHDHAEKVSWSAFVGTMVGLAAVVVPILVVVM